MVLSFADRETQLVWNRVRVRRFGSELQRAAHRKLLMLHASDVVGDLRSPPGNRLERLHEDRVGQYSIRINNQWRICFRFSEAVAEDVEITDYH